MSDLIGECQTKIRLSIITPPPQYYDIDVFLDPADTSDYSVALGLNMLHLGQGTDSTDREFDSGVIAQDREYFTVRLNTSTDKQLNGAGVSYFKKTQADTNFQFGCFSTKSIRKWNISGPPYIDAFIPFESPFNQPPKVFVGITGFFLQNCWNLRVYTDNISVGGFDIHVETSGDTWYGGAEVSWIAFAADKPNVAMGSFKGDGVGRLPYDGYTSFDANFPIPPSIFTAITQFDADPNPDVNFDLKVTADNVTSTGMQWHINSSLNSVTAAYLALNP